MSATYKPDCKARDCSRNHMPPGVDVDQRIIFVSAGESDVCLVLRPMPNNSLPDSVIASESETGRLKKTDRISLYDKFRDQ